MTDYQAHWPAERNPDREDRLRYYAEQRRLRQLELDEPLSDFDKAAVRDWATRICAATLSIDKEILEKR